jgi:hypothetical protein
LQSVGRMPETMSPVTNSERVSHLLVWKFVWV